MDMNRNAARKAAVNWWRDNLNVNAICDGRSCHRPIHKGDGYLCHSLTFGSADLVCETCFDGSAQYEAFSSQETNEPVLESHPDAMERQLNEVLKSFGFGVHIVRVVFPTDDELPHAKYACDHHYHLGQAYLTGNQSRLAIHRFRQALNAFNGNSQYDGFEKAVRLFLAESYAAVDVERWEEAKECIEQVLLVSPEDDRAHAMKARVQVRMGQFIDAYRSARAALKVNPRNFEASCYLGILGFQTASGDCDLTEMSLSIKNLEITQSLYPLSSEIAGIISQFKNELELCRSKMMD